MSEVDLFGAPVQADPAKKRKDTKPGGYARTPGSGPAGQTCGSCRFCIGTGAGRHTYYKCEIIKFRWTRGPGTDILKKSPACSMWMASPK